MKQLKKIVGIVTLVCSMFACCMMVKAGTVTPCNVACPSFSFVDHSGNAVTNSTISGKTTIMMFSTNYCNYGKAMINEIGRSDWFPNDNVNFVFGMFDGTEVSVREFRQIYTYDGMQFCYTSPSNNMTSTAFDMFHMTGGTGSSVSTPLTFIIDANGMIRYCFESYVEIDELASYVDDYADLTYSINDANVFTEVNTSERVYNGYAHTPSVYVSKWYYNLPLSEGTHYTVSYENNTNAGTAYAVITGKGYMTGTKKIPFYITPYRLTADCVSPIATQYYTGTEVKPSVGVVCNGKALVAGKDYTITYGNNTKPGTATLVVIGKGNYAGAVSKNFTIKEITGFTVNNQKYEVTSSTQKTVQYTGNKKAKAKVTIPEYVTYKNVKYMVTSISGKAFKNNKKVTTVSIASSITKIPNSAFQGCTKLKTVTLGTGIKTIGKKAFYGCKALKKLTIKSKNVKSVGANAFKGIHSKCVIIVPGEKLDDYKKIFKNKGQAKTVKIKK